MLYPSVVMTTNTGLIFVRQRDIGSLHSREQAPAGTTMCGIVALFPDERPLDAADGVLLRAMTARLRHRGPDGARTALEPRFGLGTARLRILDPRSAADLPFVSDDGRVLLAYNGEVTNFRELRARFELDRDGPFQTGSDVEVVVRLYQRLGIAFLGELTGQFAFVLVDRDAERAWAVRDFFGIRPLFYAVAGGRLALASEIKALLELPTLGRELDLEGLYHYFSLAYIPEAHTPFRDVREVPGAHLLEVDLRSGRWHQREYWRLEYRPDPTLCAADLVGPLYEAMKDSVRRNLVSDAPVGLTFSGGFDTSSILALARELHPADRLPTYSVVMQEPSFDESRWQRLMIDPARDPHHEIPVGPREVEATLLEHLAYLDEPSGDGAAIPFFLLAREASREVRVLLSGEGGDETFNAYETHAANKARRLYRGFVPAPLRRLVGLATHALPCDFRKLSFDFVAKRFTEGAEMSVRADRGGQAEAAARLCRCRADRAPLLEALRQHVLP
jgi:asparagine synthase (glutamine-hydrolysing)